MYIVHKIIITSKITNNINIYNKYEMNVKKNIPYKRR